MFQSTLPTRGSDIAKGADLQIISEFQSTLPTRGSDAFTQSAYKVQILFQSTLPTRGSDHEVLGINEIYQVSIHAPHEGERHYAYDFYSHFWAFQSTLPTRGSDNALTTSTRRMARFNPRSPRGGATSPNRQRCTPRESFQSTLPTRGSDQYIYATADGITVSIHAPHEGERRFACGWRQNRKEFQSTLPTRGSDGYLYQLRKALGCFNPRSPRGGATRHTVLLSCSLYLVSIHAPHEGERRRRHRGGGGKEMFQSTLPTRGSDTEAA